jgi:predicted amidohydrolase YtcJ
MVRKGVLVSVNSDSAEHARRLNTEAAKSMRWGGLTEDEALALVTINPAKQLRIDNRVGSIEVGKDADIAVWDRDMLTIPSDELRNLKAELTIVQGQVVYNGMSASQTRR